MNVKKIREDFPFYNGDNRSIFLDSACQTLRPKQVVDAVMEYYEEYPVCAGRSTYRLASKLQQKCEESRDSFAKFVGTEDSRELSFTKNATEGINIVLFGKKWTEGDEIICSDHEHNSVLVPIIKLAERYGVKIKQVKSLPEETLDIEHFKEIISDKTRLVLMCQTSNITGYTMPVRDVAEIAHDAGAELMIDGAQSAPHREINVRDLGVDYFSFSVHKMCGPSGVGILYGRYSLLEKIEPLIYGGMAVNDSTYQSAELLGPPHRFEAGLQNYSGIIGAGAAVKYLQGIGMNEIAEHEASLNARLLDRLRDIDGLQTIAPKNIITKSGILGFNISGYDSHDLAWILDLTHNVMIRSGHHCCHSWFHARGIDGCARSSLYLYNDENDVDVFAGAVRELTSANEKSN